MDFVEQLKSSVDIVSVIGEYVKQRRSGANRSMGESPGHNEKNIRANLQSQAGEAARCYIAKRGLAPETVEHFGLGYSDRAGRALVRLFEQRGFPVSQMEESGLVGKREDGS